MQDLFRNLPGHLTEFEDGGLKLRFDPTPPSTDSILLLGTAVDGPVMEPIAVDSQTAEALFGRPIYTNGIPNGSTLMRGFEEAWTAGARDVRLMRISGSTSVLTINAAETSAATSSVLNKVLGEAPGNIETTFVLAGTDINASTLEVYADNVKLTLTQDYTFAAYVPADPDAIPDPLGAVPASVTILADATSPMVPVFVMYKDTEGEQHYESGEGTGGDFIPWETDGADEPFDITTLATETVIPTGTKLYANGELLSADAFSIAEVGTAWVLTLVPGYATKDAILEISTRITVSGGELPTIVLNSVFGGAVYNQISLKIENAIIDGLGVVGKQITITKPETKKRDINEPPLVYLTRDHGTLGLLVQAINTDARNDILRAFVSPAHANLSSDNVPPKATTLFSGGSDGVNLSKEQLYTQLEEAYKMLQNYNTNWIVPCGVYADDDLIGKYDSFSYQLAMACAVISHRNDTTVGVIAASGPAETGLSAINTHVNKVVGITNDFFMLDTSGRTIYDTDGKPIDLGKFLRIIAGPELTIQGTRLGRYSTDGAALYAGMVSAMMTSSSPMNKVVPGVIGMRYRYSTTQLDKLVGARYITFHTNAFGNVVVTDAMTAAQPGSDYTRETTMRTVSRAVNEIRAVAAPFLGEANTPSHRNSLAAAIDKRLSKMQEAGNLTDYSFQIISTAQDQLLGRARIELSVIPALEFRKITTVVSLRPNL